MIQHRHRFPDFWSTKNVPLQEVAVNWDHPLANGMIACYVPGGERGLADLTGIGPVLAPVSSAAVIGPTSYGPGLVSRAAGSGMTSTTIPAAWKLPVNSGGSIFVAQEYFGTSPVGVPLFGIEFNAAETTPFLCYGLNSAATTGKLEFDYVSSGALQSVLGAVITATGRCSFGVSFTITSGTTIQLYQLGAVGLTGTWTGTTAPTYTGPPMVYLAGDRANSTLTLGGSTVAAYMYNRALTAAEHAQLDREPFCMLQTVRPRARSARIDAPPPDLPPAIHIWDH